MVRFNQDYEPSHVSSFNVSAEEMCIIYKSMFYFCKNQLDMCEKYPKKAETIAEELEPYIHVMHKIKAQLKIIGIKP